MAECRSRTDVYGQLARAVPHGNGLVAHRALRALEPDGACRPFAPLLPDVPAGGEETGGDIPEVPTPIIPEDTTNPTCTMTVSGTTITVNTSDNVGIDASSIDSSWSPTVGNTYTKTFNSATTYTFSMKDTSGNTGSCSIQIINKPMWGCITTMGNNPIENNTNFCYKK